MENNKTNPEQTIIYVLIKDEIYEGEDWGKVIGGFREREKAEQTLRKERDKVYDEWKDQEIDEDSENAFCAYNQYEYSQNHINIYIAETKLY